MAARSTGSARASAGPDGARSREGERERDEGSKAVEEERDRVLHPERDRTERPLDEEQERIAQSWVGMGGCFPPQCRQGVCCTWQKEMMYMCKTFWLDSRTMIHLLDWKTVAWHVGRPWQSFDFR